MDKPVIGLALGSGAAKGYAHIGVLQVLEREKIPIDIIVGSSIGSLIGALYASGINAIMLEKLARKIRRRQWVDLTIPKVGLIAGDKIEAIIRLLTKNNNFDELNIPLGVMATDLSAKQSVLITKGNVAEAVRASIAIPGIFCPRVVDGKPLVDGGVLERVPGKQVKMMGADFVIGVELGFSNNKPVKNIYDVLLQTFDVMGKEIQILKKYDCDIVITPELSDINLLAFNQVSKCISEGRKAVENMLPKIRECIEKRVKE
ncbi:MAG: patatin-like phospholipase family protein [Tepidanaerobacteraceae bacterium]|nr:patatin-like phospholipase family protein [Tepidanaerobacteraceae bacterium]